MPKEQKSRTDNYLFRIKDNKVLSIIIVVGIIVTVILTFWKTLSDTLGSQKETSIDSVQAHKDSTIKISELNRYELMLLSYNADSLRNNKLVHAFVARRDFFMHFIISADLDLIEPIDGPAGLRYKSYYLPKNPNCTVTAWADIVCISDLIDSAVYSSDSTLTFDEASGSCTLDECVSKRLSSAQKNLDNFEILTVTPALKYCKDSYDGPSEVETKRIRYKFTKGTQNYMAMEIVAFINQVEYSLQFIAPEEVFLEKENMFIQVSNTIYFERP